MAFMAFAFIIADNRNCICLGEDMDAEHICTFPALENNENIC